MIQPTRKLSALGRREIFTGYALIAPFMILMFIFCFFVFFSGFAISLTDMQGVNPGEFIGLANYREVLTSPELYAAIKTTFFYTLGALATQVPVAFLLACLLNSMKNRFLSNFLRAAFFLPVLINTVVIALLFRMLFNKDQGIINWILGVIGLPNNIEWLMNSQYSIPLLIIVSFWQWTGFHMVYFMAQLQTIDASIYEAARIDGSGSLRTMFRITVPLMKPAFAYVMITAAIGCLQMFDLVFMLFPNALYGPGGSAKTLVAYIFDQAFNQDFRIGFASAIGWVVFAIIFVVSLFQLKFLGVGSKEE